MLQGILSGVREYVPGDRLRLLHWPTMARTGELMVRDFEVPRPRKVTVLVDTRTDEIGTYGMERALAGGSRVRSVGVGPRECH
jgi:uncharacterized protein (DUF58 family)